MDAGTGPMMHPHEGTLPPALFLRGDLTGDRAVAISEVVSLAVILFMGGAPPASLDVADADDNGFVGLSDVIYIAGYLFTAGPSPGAPFLSCGQDPTNDGLLCYGSAESCP